MNQDSFFVSHRLPVALAASKRGFQVHIATKFTNHFGKLKQLGFELHPLNLDRKSTNVFANIGTLVQIIHLFRFLKPDVVHLVTIKPVILGGIAARLTGVPSLVAAISGLGYVFTSQGDKAKLRRWFVGILYRLALSHKNLMVIFQNDDDRLIIVKLAKLASYETEIISGSGVDLNIYSPAPYPKGIPVVVLAARLLVDKGVREFVEAARVLRKKNEACRFILVGNPDNGNPAAISDNELGNWISEGVVEWHGYSDDMPNIFARSYLVVLPSYREGLPKVLIEAAACGRAVVTTDVPGCRDAVVHGLTGLLVPARDPEALAEAICSLLYNPTLCKKMGRQGRELAKRYFDVKKVVTSHLDIYKKILENKR